MKKLAVLFNRAKKKKVFVEAPETSSKNSETNFEYEAQDADLDEVPFILGNVIQEKNETRSCVITSNAQQMTSFQNPSNKNLKNMVCHRIPEIGNISTKFRRKSEESQNLLNPRMNAKSLKTVRNSTYVLKIKDSKYFHIGSQKIVNVKSNIKKDLQSSSFLETITDQWTGKFNDVLEELLDSYKGPTEEIIAIISLGLNEKWKEFGRKLGFGECFLYEIEVQNERNTTLIAYDMLKQYVFQFPNTTFGFVVSILMEISQKSIIHEIIKQQSKNNFLSNCF